MSKKYLVCVKFKCNGYDKFYQYYIVNSKMLKKIKLLDTEKHGGGTADQNDFNIKYYKHTKISKHNADIIKFIANNKDEKFSLKCITELLHNQIENQNLDESCDFDNGNESSFDDYVEKTIKEKLILLVSDDSYDCVSNISQKDIIRYVRDKYKNDLACLKKDKRLYHFFYTILQHYGYDFLVQIYDIFRATYNKNEFNVIIEANKIYDTHILVDIYNSHGLSPTIEFISKFYDNKIEFLDYDKIGILDRLDKKELLILKKYLKTHSTLILTKDKNGVLTLNKPSIPDYDGPWKLW